MQIASSLGVNAPNSIIVTSLFNGSTGVVSTFLYNTTNSLPLASTITTMIAAAAASTSAQSLGGLVANSLSVLC